MDKPGINKNLLLIIFYTPFDKKSCTGFINLIQKVSFYKTLIN